jgi:hypothetical protein
MVEGTRQQYVESRFTEIDERNARIEGRLQGIEEGLESFKLDVAGQYSRLHDLITSTLGSKETEAPNGNGKGILGSVPGSSYGEPRPQGQTSSCSKVNTDTTLRPPKLIFPEFDGEDPKVWIRKSERFFLVHPVASDQKVIVASIHFKKKKPKLGSNHSTPQGKILGGMSSPRLCSIGS